MAFVTRDEDGVPDPAFELGHVLTLVAGKSVRDVHDLRREVFENLDVPGRGGEGKDLSWVGDQGEGLLVKRVEGVVGLGFRGGDAG